jgi:glycosyltransferase involved in cell wall biosynthesis
MVAISVVMPAYNASRYIKDAIESILNQTITDFELIIVNDASADQTEDIILSYTDKRIRYFKNETNRGIAFTRNLGMEKATGKYIAVMDSDDISLPDRLEKQFLYMESHPEIDILGSAMTVFSDDYRFIKQFPTDPEYVKAYLYFRNPLAQPTVMMRKDFLIKNNLAYNPEIKDGTEDYDFWFIAAMNGAKITNLEESQVNYRISETQISNKSNDYLRTERLHALFRSKLNLLNISIDDENFLLFYTFIWGRIDINDKEFNTIIELFQKIEEANNKTGIFKPEYFKAVILSFRLRLIKYRYLEKKKVLAFLIQLSKLILNTGLNCCRLFWTNEGRFIKKLPAKALI